jgi:hypothetical protein
MFQTEFVVKIKTLILCSVKKKKNRAGAVYEIMWKKFVQVGSHG